MSSLREHLHHGVLGVLVDRVVPEALPEVLLDHLVFFFGSGGGWVRKKASIDQWVCGEEGDGGREGDKEQTLPLRVLAVLLCREERRGSPGSPRFLTLSRCLRRPWLYVVRHNLRKETARLLLVRSYHTDGCIT